MNIQKIRYYLFSVMYIVFLVLFAAAVSKKYDNSGYNEPKLLFIEGHKKLMKKVNLKQFQNSDFIHLNLKTKKIAKIKKTLSDLFPEFLDLLDQVTIIELDKKEEANELFKDIEIQKQVNKLTKICKKLNIEIEIKDLDKKNSLISINKLATAYYLAIDKTIEEYEELTPLWIGEKAFKPNLIATYKNKSWQDSSNEISFYLALPINKLQSTKFKTDFKINNNNLISKISHYTFLNTSQNGDFSTTANFKLEVKNFTDKINLKHKINYQVVKPIYLARTIDDQIVKTIILFKNKANYYKLYKGGEFLGEFAFRSNQADFIKTNYNIGVRILDTPNYSVTLIDNEDYSYSISLYKHPLYEKVTKDIGKLKECLVIEKSNNRLLVNINKENRLITLKNHKKNDKIILKINGQKVILKVK